MMALDLQPGDEVITPSFTYIATVEAAALLKLQPVFVEVDPADILHGSRMRSKRQLRPKPKRSCPFIYTAMPQTWKHIMQIAEQHQLYVIEDNAQAIGCDYTFS